MSGTPPRTLSSGGPPARATLEFLDDDDDVRDGAAPPPEQSLPSSASSNSAQPSAHRLAVGDIHPSALKSIADGTGDGTAATMTTAAEGSSTDGGVLGRDVTKLASTADQTHGDGGFDDDDDESSSADDENIVALDAAAVGAAAAPVRRRDAEVPGDKLPGTPAGPSAALYGHGHHQPQPSMLEGATVAAPKPIVRRPREERRVCLPDALGAVHRIDIERMHDVPPNPWPISGAEGWWFDARPLLELGTFSDPAAHPDDLAGDAPFDIRPAPVGQRAGGHQHQLAVEVARGARGNTYTIYRRDIPVRGLRDIAALPPTVAPFPSVLSNGGGIKKAVMAFSGLRTVSLSTARVDPAAFASPSRAAWPISIPTRGGGGPAAPASRTRGAPGSHAASSPKTQQARPSQPQPPVPAQAVAAKATTVTGGTRGVWAAASEVPSSVPPPPVTPPPTLGSKHLVATKGVAARPQPLAKSLPSPPRPYVAVPVATAPAVEQTPPAYRAPPPPVNASLQQQSGQRGSGSGGKHGKATSSSAAARPTVPIRGRAPPPIVVSKKLSPPPPSQPRKGGAVPLPAGISRVVNAQASSASSAAAAATPSSPPAGGVPPPSGPRFPPPPPTS